jgi:hypothetical protein
MTNRHGLDPGERRLGRGLGGANDPVEPGALRALGRHQDAADRADSAVEGKLAHRGVLLETRDRDLVRSREHRERDREIEPGPLLAQRSRGEVDRDPLPPARPLQLGRDDPAANALLRLLARTVGEAHDREARDTAVEVRLDLDAAGVEADESVRDRPCEHLPTLDAFGAPNRHRFVPTAGQTVHTRRKR